MPSKSPEQARFMQAIARSPKFAKKAGVPQAVGREFALADLGRKLGPIKQAPRKKGKRS